MHESFIIVWYSILGNLQFEGRNVRNEQNCMENVLEKHTHTHTQLGSDMETTWLRYGDDGTDDEVASFTLVLEGTLVGIEGEGCMGEQDVWLKT